MIKVGMFAISLIVLAACGDSEPVATSYKKSMAAGAPGAAVPAGTAPGGADATALKAQGTTLYNSKCAACHGAIASSLKQNRTAAQITASATNPNHTSVQPFPNATEAQALEAALKK